MARQQVDMVMTGRIDPLQMLTQDRLLRARAEAFRAFDAREAGWIKVELDPEA